MIYIFCRTDFATGGTELLHQLNVELKEQGAESAIVFTDKYEGSPVHKKFSHYPITIADKIEDTSDNWLIVPEACPELAVKYKKINKALWWLSVDNYYGVDAPEKHQDIIHKLKRKLFNKYIIMHDRKWTHLVQCRHIYDYVNKVHGIPEKQIHYLTDFISSEHTENHEHYEKENTIVYNPKKGLEFVKKLMEAFPQYKWLALENMTSEQVSEAMNKAKLYVDFGPHPGKDRMPREAALAKCCIITGKRGSAGNPVDVPIPEYAKFDQEKTELSDIGESISRCINDYEEVIADYAPYVERIKKEKEVFQKEVGELIKRVSKK